MYLIKAIIDILIILLFLRLLVRPNESYFNQIFSLLYRITDPLLIPSRYLARNNTVRIFLVILCLVALRGFVYALFGSISPLSGLGYSFLGLFQLLFQFYMVIWFVSVLSRYDSGVYLMNIAQRSFLPFNIVSAGLGIPGRHFYLFIFFFCWILYGVLSFLIYNVILMTTNASFSIVHGLAEGLLLFIRLFPGFFSLVIIIGAILSWVSPDPYNPVVQTIYSISEPLLDPFRKFIPNLGGLDISPILAIICFQVIGKLGQRLVAGILVAI